MRWSADARSLQPWLGDFRRATALVLHQSKDRNQWRLPEDRLHVLGNRWRMSVALALSNIPISRSDHKQGSRCKRLHSPDIPDETKHLH